MPGTASKFTSAIISAIALGLMAVIPAGISIYMFAAMVQSRMVFGTMVILAALLGFTGLGLAIGCVYSIWWAFTKAAQPDELERDDDSWKDMPYPKG